MASGDGQALPVPLPGASYLALANGTGKVPRLVTTFEYPPQRGLRRDCNGGRLACEHSAPLAITPRLSVRPPDGHIRLMKARAAESDVVKFLRATLAERARAVTEPRGKRPSGRIAQRTAAHHGCKAISTSERVATHKIDSGWLWIS